MFPRVNQGIVHDARPIVGDTSGVHFCVSAQPRGKFAEKIFAVTFVIFWIVHISPRYTTSRA